MTGETILVLEDDLLTMKGLFRHLQDAGYQVVKAATTSEAVNALWTYQVDLMILDLTLLAEDPFTGVSDGFAFRQWVRNLFPQKDIPVILHTADDSPNLEWRALSHGIAKIVRKGAGMGELLATVRQALDERNARQGQLPEAG